MARRDFDRVYGSRERVGWIKAQPCVFCGDLPSQNAHVTNGGLGRKADARYIIPACAQCHWELDHGRGKRAMERDHKVSLKALAEETEQRWQQRGGRTWIEDLD